MTRGRLVPVIVIALVLLGLDLAWLGLVARHFYADALGPLQRPHAFVPAAIAFYVMYVLVIALYAVWPARWPREAAWRGAGLGFVAYATYELTSWAVIAGWPARLVAIDIAWGVVLTSSAAWAGRRVAG